MTDIRLFSIDELEKRGFGSASRIRNLIRGKKLIARKDGVRTVVRSDDLEFYLASLPEAGQPDKRPRHANGRLKKQEPTSEAGNESS